MKSMVIIQQTHLGLLAEITDLLAANKIDLNDFSGNVVRQMSVISLQPEPYEDAFRILSEAGYHVYASETLLVRLPQAPGALAQLSRRLADAGVSIRGLHIVGRDAGAGIVALETEDQDEARLVLKDQLVN
ncbi:MAG: hypothetical protein KJO54_02990 [Gammaproteobacteria bacterium]|nr:hypothetical protein [Gammaproteobacteria bacterium]NNF61691.1 hypothetical protein [Gammaproteobacteria bacterium]NNM20321.1 hypothetical protein [Gammaproteobacteria bacterium]